VCVCVERERDREREREKEREIVTESKEIVCSKCEFVCLLLYLCQRYRKQIVFFSFVR